MRAQKGSVSLEALISMMFMMVVIGVTWGVCVLIFNMATVNTAAQFSAQSALLTYDRSTYRGHNVNNSYERAVSRAERVSWEVFKENTCGAMIDPFTSEKPNTSCGSNQGPPSGTILSPFRLSLECSPSRLTGGGSTLERFRESNCRGGNAHRAGVLRAEVRSDLILPFSLPGNPFSGDDASSRNFRIRTVASAYSYVRTR